MKAASISSSVPAFRIGSCTPFVRAASCMSPLRPAALGSSGFTSRAITLACGTSSVSSSSHLGISSN